MKVNIGCGRKYLYGWLNTDALPNPLADKIMPAWQLELEPQSCSKILAAQVTEHLGFFRTRYFLSEAFRVLSPGGELTIETPDIETTFDFFAKAPQERRERLMQWIYGLETPGMGHIFCHPAELLASEIKKAGFELKTAERFSAGPDNPALRITALRQAENPNAAFMSIFRRALTDTKTAITSSELETAEQEKLMETLAARFADCAKTGAFAALADMLAYAAVSQETVEAFFSAATRANPASPDLSAALSDWKRHAFSSAVRNVFLDSEILPLTHIQCYNRCMELAGAAAAALLAGKPPQDALKLIIGTDIPRDHSLECPIPLFAPDALKHYAALTSALAAKEMTLSRYDGAKKLYELSLRLWRDNIPAYWTSARLLALENDAKNSSRFYEHTIAGVEALGADYKPLAAQVLKEARDICLIKENGTVAPITEITKPGGKDEQKT